MNSSQLLYKISNLQYCIRMRESEHARAMNAGDQLVTDGSKVSIANLKEELAASVAEYNSIPANSIRNISKAVEKTPWWRNFLNVLFSRNK